MKNYYCPLGKYHSKEHQEKVVEDIKENWVRLSHNGKFHAIFATSSIPEAIEYYRLIKERIPTLKTTCLFDPNIDNNGGVVLKEDGLIEIISDYNTQYGMDYNIPTHAKFKKDIALRLAHKEQYKRIEREPQKQLDLLIVVDQMLTGFDSKWVNTLYMDKILEYENIIQAFSRTNRLFGPDKPFGVIRYYRKPHTMEQNVARAVKLYSGDKPIGLFVEKLSHNLEKMNSIFNDMSEVFKNANIPDFTRLPEEKAVKAKFASLFRDFNTYLEAAKVQGFNLLASLELKDKVNWDYFILLVAKTGMRFSELIKHLPEDKPIFVDGAVYNSTVNNILARHCKECNIPVISIHGLRHTHASLLLFTGVSIASVARRLGHSSMTTTQKTYLHIIQELENKDIDLVMRSLSSLS